MSQFLVWVILGIRVHESPNAFTKVNYFSLCLLQDDDNLWQYALDKDVYVVQQYIVAVNTVLIKFYLIQVHVAS